MPIIHVSTNVLLVIAGIGMLIFIHELGHFLVAKKIGVKVHAFSLGFGPAIFKKTYGDTEYRLAVIPLGGYVKLAGETVDSENTGAEDEFMSKPPGKRAAVLGAGVTLNAILAFIVFIVAFNIGVPFIGTEIGEVVPGWPAWEEGLQQGDKIIRINNNDDPDFEDIFTEIALTDKNTGVRLGVQRDDKVFDLMMYPKYDERAGVQRIGIRPAASLQIAKLFEFNGSRSPAVEAGLKVDDIIVAIDGKKLKTGNEFIRIVSTAPDKELALTVLRDGKEFDTQIKPKPESRWMLGISSASTHIEAVRKGSMAKSIGLVNNDEIISVNSESVTGWSQVNKIISETNSGALALEVANEGRKRFLELPIIDEKTKIKFFRGISTYSTLRVDNTLEGFPAEKIGLEPGDTLLALDGKNLETWEELLQLIAGGNGKAMAISWSHNGKIKNGEITPIKNEKQPFGKVGIKLKDNTILKQYGFLGSLGMGVNKTIVNVQRIYFTIKGFITGKVSNKALGGPILIAQASYESAKLGIGKLLYFLGIISINLAFLNILPVPVLDGGHLLFLLVEKIKGSPVSERTMSIANYVGMGLVLTLVLFATRNDVMRIFKGF